MNPIAAYIFDLDGVIVDTAVYHYQAWNRLANELGFSLSHEDNEELKGVSRMDSLEIILAKGGVSLSQERKVELAARKNEWYVEAISGMGRDDLLPGVRPFVNMLRALGFKTAVASASKNARAVLRSTELFDAFDAIVDGTNVTRAKPDPEIFLKAAAGCGVAPENCVVFEDARSGIEGALAAGMTAIGIGSPEVLSAAHKVFPSIEAIHSAQF